MHELIDAGGHAAGADDEYVLDTDPVRSLIAHVRDVVQRASSPAAACDAIRPQFADLLDDQQWLPAK